MSFKSSCCRGNQTNFWEFAQKVNELSGTALKTTNITRLLVFLCKSASHHGLSILSFLSVLNIITGIWCGRKKALSSSYVTPVVDFYIWPYFPTNNHEFTRNISWVTTTSVFAFSKYFTGAFDKRHSWLTAKQSHLLIGFKTIITKEHHESKLFFREIKNCFEHKDCGTDLKCINQVLFIIN